tara:strand:+ start:463 stop:888 length:426 start_codon:yes stop_codon:yes gene_type:complete
MDFERDEQSKYNAKYSGLGELGKEPKKSSALYIDMGAKGNGADVTIRKRIERNCGERVNNTHNSKAALLTQNVSGEENSKSTTGPSSTWTQFDNESGGSDGDEEELISRYRQRGTGAKSGYAILAWLTVLRLVFSVSMTAR